MKYSRSLLLLFFSVIFTGCFDILEDISLNKDGSGKYSLTFDMNDIINDPFMKEMLLEAVKNNEELNMGEREKIAVDSVMYLKDDPQFANLKNKRALWESAKMHTVIDEEKGKMFINFGFDFNEVGDIDAFFKHLGESDSSQKSLAGFDQILGGSAFAFKKKSLTRLPIAKSDQSLKDNFNEEDLSMLKMFMTDAELKTSYNFPGKVKKSSIPNSVILNNEVTVAIPLIDLMEGNAKMDGEIKFKH